PKPRRIISMGGGAFNEPWRKMREQILDIPVVRAIQQEAAYGTALLAMKVLFNNLLHCKDEQRRDKC
ncbi:MAG: carbohydrate kinase, partial [Candidatus Thiodiazotropha sp. (ex Cardiolucina cf. quadrata)]|nr:carbohydrate kinase [Candidatus Thiodiazotropha sp. (ex Cardiolucina cf. quadrata)]